MEKVINFVKKCPVFFLLAASGIVFTLIGIAGSFSVYRDYKWDAGTPFLAFMMEGMNEGVAPWEAAGTIGMGADEFPGGLWQVLRSSPIGQSIGMAGMDEVLEASAEGNGTVGLDDTSVIMENDTSPAEDISGGQGVSAPGITGGQGVDSSYGAADGQDVGSSYDAAGGPEMDAGSGVPDGTGNADESTYDFTAVTEDYFNDAVFIGDSRTVGLFEYGGIEERADFYAKISLTIYDVFTEPLVRDEETGKKITAEEGLMRKQYGKVYLMLGINELGTGTTETFMEEYRAVVEKIRELQPDAMIFVQGIMKVTGSKDATDPIFNNTNIEERNAAIAELADNRTIFYIDVNEVVCDAAGDLNAEYTIDEIHLKAKYYDIWKQFLLAHGIER